MLWYTALAVSERLEVHLVNASAHLVKERVEPKGGNSTHSS